MSEFRRHLFSILSLIALTVVPLGLAHAQVQVTAADPSSTVQGTFSLDVTVTGNGFDSSANVKFLVTGTTDTGGITVKRVTVLGAKKLVATIDVLDTAAVSKFDIEVALSNGRKGKGTTLLTVQAKQTSEPSPCVGAELRGFPSFGFSRQTSAAGQINWEYRLADNAGTCDQLVWSRAWTSRYADVFFRYDAGTHSGIALGSSNFSVVASSFSVAFDAEGKPTITAAPFAVVLTLAQLSARPLPSDPLLIGWQMGSMGNFRISPSGSSFMVTSWDIAGSAAVYWRCSLTTPVTPVDLNTCAVVYYAGAAAKPYANWGATDSTLHVLRSATSGSGSALYVVDLVNGTPAVQIYGRGTLLTASKATTVQRSNGTQSERVVLHEAGPTVCDALNIVFDLDTCSGNNCLVTNGAGHRGAAAMTWLPDGRVAQGGISKKGSNCSSSGTIDAFDPVLNMNGSVTTLTNGQDPDGAGGG